MDSGLKESQASKLPESLRQDIIEALQPLDHEKVILFGSYAWGEPTKESDIDLYVVTKDKFIPQDYKQNMEHYLKASRLLRGIRKKQSMDLVVHTKGMHEKFVNLKSIFGREILERVCSSHEAHR